LVQKSQAGQDEGNLKSGNEVLPDRFITEAKATLPIVGPAQPRLEDLFAAMTLQQIRLKHDQQVPIWEPAQEVRRR